MSLKPPCGSFTVNTYGCHCARDAGDSVLEGAHRESPSDGCRPQVSPGTGCMSDAISTCVVNFLFFLNFFKVFASTPSSPGSCCTGADLFRKDFMFPAYYLLFYLFVGSENGDFASVSQSPSICCRRLSTWAAINPAGNFLLRKQCQRRNAKVPALVCILGERTLQPPEAPLTNQLPTALPS